MLPIYFSIITSFLEGINFFSATLFLIPLKKHLKDVNFLIIFWLLVGIGLCLNGVQLLFFYFQRPNISFLVLKIAAIFVFFQMWLGINFFVRKIFLGPRIRLIVSFFTAMIFIAILIFIISQTNYTIYLGEPSLQLPSSREILFLLALAILLLTSGVIWLIIKELKNQKFSWEDLSSIYLLGGLGIYGAVSFLRTFFFLPQPWYLTMFYYLIPFLNFLAAQEKIKKTKS